MGMKEVITNAFDSLLSNELNPRLNLKSFNQLESLLLQLTQSNQKLTKFYNLQDSFQFNITTRILEYITKLLLTFSFNQFSPDEEQLHLVNLLKSLLILQGLLLLHPPSQKLFSRKEVLKNILSILSLCRPPPSSPLPPPVASSSSLPSPVLFPPSPSPSASPSPSSLSTPHSTSTLLSLSVLDTLLCALVDRPKNLRILEEIGGLQIIVKVLKDKTVTQVVRIKAIEFLYYYLLPESPLPPPPSTSTISGSPKEENFISPPPTYSTIPPNHRHHQVLLGNASSSPLIDFIPQTPIKSRSKFPPPTSSVPSSPSSQFRVSTTTTPDSPSRTPFSKRIQRRTSSSSAYYTSSYSSTSGTGSESDTPRRQLPLAPPPLPTRRIRPSSMYGLTTSALNISLTKEAGGGGLQSPFLLSSSSFNSLAKPIPPPSPSSTSIYGSTFSRSTSSLSMNPPPLPSPTARRRSRPSSLYITPTFSQSTTSLSSIVNRKEEKDKEEEDPDRTPRRKEVGMNRPSFNSSNSYSSTPPPTTTTSSPTKKKKELSILISNSSNTIISSPRLKQNSSNSSSNNGKVRGSGWRRSEVEKREMLRLVMPNVEALEFRFKAMGLMVD